MDLLETFSLSQHVSGPTHLSGHTLDLIITRSSDDVVLASPKATFPISDHFIIQCPIGFPWPALSCKELTFRKLKNIDIAEFSADIASSMLCASADCDNIDALSDCFNMTLTDILDKHVPLKTRIMINRPKIPWCNDDIKQLKRKRRRHEKKALKSDLPGDCNNYHKVRNQNSALLKSARVNCYSNLIDQCAGDSRKLFFVSRPCTQILSLLILVAILNKFGHVISAVCQSLLSCRRHIGKREDPGDEVVFWLRHR